MFRKYREVFGERGLNANFGKTKSDDHLRHHNGWLL